MARAKDPEKRQAILQSAVREIAEKGLSAPTAGIAKGADLAEGTLFNYFSSKEDLLNELYIELKTEAYRRMNAGFPHPAELRARAKHLCTQYLGWATEKPNERKVAVLLYLSPVISAAVRALVDAERGAVKQTLDELGNCGAFKNLPPGFAASAMQAMQEAVMERAAKKPREQAKLVEEAFNAFWRMAE